MLVVHWGKKKYQDVYLEWIPALWQDKHHMLVLSDHHALLIYDGTEKVLDTRL